MYIYSTPQNQVNNNPLNLQGDFFVAELFKENKSTVLISYSNLDKSEYLDFKYAPIQLGLAIDNDAIILYWDIGGLVGITLFDARLYEEPQMLTLNMANNVVELELEDSKFKTTIATRIITLPNELVEKLIKACTHQISGKAAPIGSYSPKWDTWPIDKLKSCIDTDMIYNLS